ERAQVILIAAEVALSLVLVAGAGLLMKSFLRLLSVDPGFNTHGLLTIDMELPENRYVEVAQRAEFVRDVLARLENVPGVSAAAAINAMPLTKASVWNSFSLPGASEEIGEAGFRALTPGYYKAMGIPLSRGRLLARGDRGVGVVNQSMARRYWAHEDPVGKVIETPRIVRVQTPQGWDMRFIPQQFQIVGIVGDVRHLSLANGPQRFHFPPAQFRRSGGAGARRPERNLGGGPQSAAGRCPHDGSTDRPGCSQPPFHPAASDGVRCGRGVARGGGHLRRHCAFGVATHAGNRHPHGTWRGRAGSDPHDGLANAEVDRCGTYSRRRRSARDRAAAEQLSVCGRGARSGGLGPSRDWAGRPCGIGGVYSSKRRGARGPCDNAAVRVSGPGSDLVSDYGRHLIGVDRLDAGHLFQRGEKVAIFAATQLQEHLRAGGISAGAGPGDSDVVIRALAEVHQRNNVEN